MGSITRALALALVSVGLCGCLGLGAHSEAFVTCPAPKTYPRAFQRQAAQELRTYRAQIPATSTLIGDYMALRDALKDCGKSK